ncbi:uncharacterized protein [Mytilus edulis]|uniref:uncharacterized protein n=1 Tax=Mytilus edulis TaxID=6550 RepID=UPI0039F0293E
MPGPCDRKAAHAKFAIKRYINEGRDVTTAYDMKKALDKVPGQPYRVKVVDTIHDLDVTKNKDTITNITSFYNFRFENSHLRMWQAYNIGEGKLVTLKLSKNSVQLKVLNDWTEMSLTDLITEGNFIIISFTNCHVPKRLRDERYQRNSQTHKSKMN